MRSAAPFSGRSVPVPDQLPAKSANGADSADAGGSGIYSAETRAMRQQPRTPAGEIGNREPNVRCKGIFPFKFVLRDQRKWSSALTANGVGLVPYEACATATGSVYGDFVTGVLLLSLAGQEYPQRPLDCPETSAADGFTAVAP